MLLKSLQRCRIRDAENATFEPYRRTVRTLQRLRNKVDGTDQAILVLANGCLCINLLDQVENHRDNDEECRTTDGNRGNACYPLQYDWEHGQNTEEERANERDAR